MNNKNQKYNHIMKILVTGASGMIGSYVVKGLVDNGHTVIGVDRVNPKVEYDGVTSVILDLASKGAVERVFEEHQIDRCIHLAALAHTKGVADTSWEAFKKVNVDCAVNLFEACAKHNGGCHRHGEGGDYAPDGTEPDIELREEQGDGGRAAEGDLLAVEYLPLLAGIYGGREAGHPEAVLPEVP